MAINMASKSPDELKTLIANHERIGKTDTERLPSGRGRARHPQ